MGSKMKRLINHTIILSVILSVVIIIVNGCGEGRNMDEIEELEPMEIKEYEGTKL